MVKKFILVIVVLFAFQSVKSQDTIVPSYKKNLIYPSLGLMEDGIFITLGLNYERQLFKVEKFNFNVKANYNIWGAWAVSGDFYSFSLNSYRSFRSHHVGLELGYVFIKYDYEEGISSDSEPMGSLGYKFQKPDRHFLFKMYISTWGTYNLGVGVAF